MYQKEAESLFIFFGYKMFDFAKQGFFQTVTVQYVWVINYFILYKKENDNIELCNYPFFYQCFRAQTTDQYVSEILSYETYYKTLVLFYILNT